MNTDQDFTFSSHFANEATNVMFSSAAQLQSVLWIPHFHCHTKNEEVLYAQWAAHISQEHD